MAYQIGCDGSFSVGNKEVGYIDSFSLTIDKASSDVTGLGKGWREYLSTIKSWNGSANGVVLDSVEHKELIEDLITGTDTTLSCIFKTGSDVSFKGSVKVTSASISATQGEKTSISFNFQGTGALTVTGLSAGSDA